jgi:hypothetical protein
MINSSTTLDVSVRCFAALLACALTVGCSRPAADYSSTPLSGSVKVKGTPIPHGEIYIAPRGAGQGRGVNAPIVDGKYSFEKAPLGEVLVSFHAMRDTGRTYYSEQAGKEMPELESLIPVRYELGVPLTITDGMGTHDFDLK